MKCEVVNATEDYITPLGLASSSSRIAEAGSVLIVVRSGILQHSIPVAIAGCDVAINQDMRALLPSRYFVARYLAWWIRGNAGRLLTLWRREGATVESLESEQIGNTCVPLLSLEAQGRVADFLDRKTAEIDALIAKKERMIALLNEKRQACITEAVTKGLDAQAPTRESGEAWLGRVPAHWQVKRLRFISPSIQVGIVVTPARYYVESGVPCLRSLNIRPSGIDANDLVFISPQSNALLSKSRLERGDLVAVRTGQPGMTAVVTEQYNGCNCIDLIIVRRAACVVPEYLCHVMNSSFARAQYAAGSDGAIQQHFNIETASNLLIPLPEIAEQQRIVFSLESAVQRIDGAVGDATRSIALLREYRQALISEAVAGRVGLGASAVATPARAKESVPC